MVAASCRNFGRVGLVTQIVLTNMHRACSPFKIPPGSRFGGVATIGVGGIVVTLGPFGFVTGIIYYITAAVAVSVVWRLSVSAALLSLLARLVSSLALSTT